MTTDTIETGLGDLRVAAPSTLRPNVLTELGIADWYATMASPIGPLVVVWNGLGVSEVEEAEGADDFEAAHRARTGRVAYRADALPDRLASAIVRRLDGDRRVRIDLDLRGHTDFERSVWLKALEIPHGEVRPYGWIATEIGRPKAVRAVGSALGHNPVPLIVPCHRVVRSDGLIGQYSMGGPEAKRRVLAAEGLDPRGLEAEAAAGRRYTGSDTTHIVCHTTCRDARRVTDRHRVFFPSLAAAANAGYRPCKHCRPVSVASAA
jgi:O-6-methylguanine DNA methyltransferase